MAKGSFTETTRRFFTWQLSLIWRTPHICGFLNCFILSHLLPTSCLFWNVWRSSCNYRLNFEENRSNFCRLDVVVCCWAGNQYSNVGCNFSKFLKNGCALRVNEIKVTLRNAFIGNLSTWERKKELKNVKNNVLLRLPADAWSSCSPLDDECHIYMVF